MQRLAHPVVLVLGISNTDFFKFWRNLVVPIGILCKKRKNSAKIEMVGSYAEEAKHMLEQPCRSNSPGALKLRYFITVLGQNGSGQNGIGQNGTDKTLTIKSSINT